MTVATRANTFPSPAGPSKLGECSSSPSRKGGRAATLGSLTGREGISPLIAARIIPTSRRGVNFSPQPETKYFNSSDSILPIQDENDNTPPASIRSYLISGLDLAAAGGSSPSCRSETPLNVRSILNKQRINEIRLAASVEEGTLNNKEAARLKVSGKRPRLQARDSFQLAMIRRAAGEGLGEGVPTGDMKGKEKLVEEAPASDDSALSEEAADDMVGEKDGSSELEEELEEDGECSTGQLVNWILDGAEDLLTLEEAYTTLTLRLRRRLPDGVAKSSISAAMLEEIQLSIDPIRDEAPAMVRAMLRDLQRLLGKVPNSEIPESSNDTTPFRGLMPLSDRTPINSSRLTPSPSPLPAHKRLSPDGKPARQGFTEAEVRYRRESSGVGAAALRFLAFVLHMPQLYTCFSEADLTALLEQTLLIPRTPRLPTPNPKRSYFLSITVLAQMRIPAACVAPIRDKASRAVESGLTDGLGGSPSPNAKDSGGQIKKEAYHAVGNLFSTYPSIFLQAYTDLLPACLRGLAASSIVMRNKAAAALAAIASAKCNVASDIGPSDAWLRNKALQQKVENFVVSHFRAPAKGVMKSSTIGPGGEKRTEWHELERVLKETVGSATQVQWACAAWASVVTLMGSAYATSNLTSQFDYIMDRSLQPSTNAVRPLLARAAWSHAVHAYFSSGITSSRASDGQIIISYRPFVASASGDYVERMKTIQFPFELAMTLALDKDSVKRVMTDGKWQWIRSEKSKKLQWVITCGQSAASVIYAYTGTALYHQDQPAKEMAAISGLPSSDGAPISEQDEVEARHERLDKVWDRVAHPMIKSLISICGINQLQAHGWAILDAITSSAARSGSQEWSLDRLLAPRYLAGSAFNMEESALGELMETIEKEAVRAPDIPGWGSEWIIRRFEDLLDLFQHTLSGVTGLDESVKYVIAPDGMPVIPMSLGRIWNNLLQGLAKAMEVDDEQYLAGLRSITRHLSLVLNRDPTTYVAHSGLNAGPQSADNWDRLRLATFTYLFDMAVTVLGPQAMGSTKLPRSEQVEAVDGVLAQGAYGGDAAGVTVAGCLLGQITKNCPLTFPLLGEGFKVLLQRILDVGASQGSAGTKLLGDIANHMPWILPDQEAAQLDVWRITAMKYADVLDLQPKSTSGATNHTGAILVSLLSGPFRGRDVMSQWHGNSKIEDLAAWQALLKVTILRFRARRVGSNLGVLESLAGHLSDFLETDQKTTSSSMTLSCLASAASFISFVPPEAHHAAHFAINENFVPIDFLALVSTALFDSYPSPQSLGDSSQGGSIISYAVSDLINSLTSVITSLPAKFVEDVLEPLKTGLVPWLKDEAKIVQSEMAEAVDAIYIAILQALTLAVQAGHIASTAETLDRYIDLFADRLSRAQSPLVPKAFGTFYNASFSRVKAEDMPESVREFLEDILAAVPGMIKVPGLQAPATLSEEESQAKYPHAYQFANIEVPQPEPEPEPEVLVDATVIDIEMAPSSDIQDPSGEYDADASQSQTQSRGVIVSVGVTTRSKLPTIQAVDESSLEAQQGGDVFGPTAKPIKNRRRKGQSRRRGAQARPLGKAESMPEPKRATPADIPDEGDSSRSLPAEEPRPLVPESQATEVAEEPVEPVAEEIEDCIVVRTSPGPPYRSRTPSEPIGVSEPTSEVTRLDLASGASSSRALQQRPSLLSSARDWFSKVHSNIFSPTATTGFDLPSIHEEEPLDRSHRAGTTSEAPSRANSTAPSSSSRRLHGKSKGKRSRESTVSEVELPKPVIAVIPPVIAASRKLSRSASAASSSKSKGKGRVRNRGKNAQRAAITPTPSSSDIEQSLAPEDEDDELLLSPETASKRRREEELSLAQAAQQAAALQSPSPKLKRTRSRTKSQLVNEGTSQESGRFDDAEESQQQPAQTAAPELDTPARRTKRQREVLNMMDQAAKASDAIAGLDFAGVVALMRDMDRIRQAAHDNLAKRADDERAAKRARRSK